MRRGGAERRSILATGCQGRLPSPARLPVLTGTGDRVGRATCRLTIRRGTRELRLSVRCPGLPRAPLGLTERMAVSEAR